METSIEFFLHLVGMARLLVVFVRIQRSQEGRGKQSLRKERGDPLFTELWRKPQKMTFKNSTYFDRGLL